MSDMQTIQLLTGALKIAIEKLTEERHIFVISISIILVVFGLAIWGIGTAEDILLIIPLSVIAVVATLALVALMLEKSRKGSSQMSLDNLYDTLLGRLTGLADTEFRELIFALLTPEQQARLPRPADLIPRAEFLNYMKIKRRLTDVQGYLDREPAS